MLALAFAVLLAALTAVIWRQGRARAMQRAIDDVRRERALVDARHAELRTRLQWLRSRERVVPAAKRELGMHVPNGNEIIILPLTRVAGRASGATIR